MMRKLALAALLLLAAGCLPPGDPPAGNVIENGEKLPVTAAEVRERMITELTTALLMYAPGATVRLETDAASRAEMFRVWAECVKLTGNVPGAQAEWTVASRSTDTTWQVTLRRRDEIVRRIELPRP